MSAIVVAKKVVVGNVVSYLKAVLDPGRRRQLEEDTTAHVLSELPRIVQLLEERCGDLEDRGCTHYEANIIAQQVIEAQKRTLDEEKRRRLSNVLVNGLSAERWDMATHRLMVRLATDLEEEHVQRLRLEVMPMEERNALMREHHEKIRQIRALPDGERARLSRESLAIEAVASAIDTELVGLELLERIRKPKIFAKPVVTGTKMGSEVYAEQDIETRVGITRLGRMFLAYLKDPTELSVAASPPAG